MIALADLGTPPNIDTLEKYRVLHLGKAVNMCPWGQNRSLDRPPADDATIGDDGIDDGPHSLLLCVNGLRGWVGSLVG